MSESTTNTNDWLKSRPLYQSFCAGANIFAGEYPGDKDPDTARGKIKGMISFGITHFVDLTEPGELSPYRQFLPPQVNYCRFPVQDLNAPKSTVETYRLIQKIDRWSREQGNKVYIHCWGGVGRTGTMVACLLATHNNNNPSMDEILDTLRKCAAEMPKSAHRKMPESQEQYDFIRQFMEDLPKLKKDYAINLQDRSRGCLMGGAAGDALGYPVEFMSAHSILAKYGEPGITRFEMDPYSGKTLVSDDTQMTLFTANGILMDVTRGAMRGIGGYPPHYVDGAYLDWYYTQTGRKKPDSIDFHYTWLRDLPELAHQRAPGNTCLSACESLLQGTKVKNNSKGCGGIMRVAPMGILYAGYDMRGFWRRYNPDSSLESGGEIAAVTHKHPLAIIPSGMLACLVYEACMHPTDEAITDFRKLVWSCMERAKKIYSDSRFPQKDEFAPNLPVMERLTVTALNLAENQSISDSEAIRNLGEGWTGEEAWAIAVFCAYRHIDDPLAALIAAVNHDGDSDSTGAITGNIMGAIYGYEVLSDRLAPMCPYGRTLYDTLELSSLTLTLADDLATGCIIGEYEEMDTPEKNSWYKRYCEMIPAF